MAFKNTMMLLFFTMLICNSFSSGASTGYKVGDDEGWIIGNEFDQWSSSKEFHVGDSLQFSYYPHSHNVIQVTREGYRSCDPTSPIAAYESDSDTITLNKPGHYYFICGVPGHCLAGQKLEVNVATSLPAPAISPVISTPPPSPKPSTPVISTPPPSPKPSTPVSSPIIAPVILAPSPSPKPSPFHVHKVGGQASWIIGPDYKNWSSSEVFRIGDTLLFSYNSYHNVMEVTQAAYESCNSSNPIASYKSGSDYINLERAGHYYFLCGAPDHCQAGQKVEVVVTSDGPALASSPSTTHPNPSSPPSTRTSPSHSAAPTTISAQKLPYSVILLVALALF